LSTTTTNSSSNTTSATSSSTTPTASASSGSSKPPPNSGSNVHTLAEYTSQGGSGAKTRSTLSLKDLHAGDAGGNTAGKYKPCHACAVLFCATCAKNHKHYTPKFPIDSTKPTRLKFCHFDIGPFFCAECPSYWPANTLDLYVDCLAFGSCIRRCHFSTVKYGLQVSSHSKELNSLRWSFETGRPRTKKPSSSATKRDGRSQTELKSV